MIPSGWSLEIFPLPLQICLNADAPSPHRPIPSIAPRARSLSSSPLQSDFVILQRGGDGDVFQHPSVSLEEEERREDKKSTWKEIRRPVGKDSKGERGGKEGRKEGRKASKEIAMQQDWHLAGSNAFSTDMTFIHLFSVMNPTTTIVIGMGYIRLSARRTKLRRRMWMRCLFRPRSVMGCR